MVALVVPATAGRWAPVPATQPGPVGEEGMDGRQGAHRHWGRCCTQATPSPWESLAARGFGSLSVWYRFLQRMNHPDNYFFSELMLEGG